MKNNKEERESNAESITATVHSGWRESLGIGSIVITRSRTSTGEFPQVLVVKLLSPMSPGTVPSTHI